MELKICSIRFYLERLGYNSASKSFEKLLDTSMTARLLMRACLEDNSRKISTRCQHNMWKGAPQSVFTCTGGVFECQTSHLTTRHRLSRGCGLVGQKRTPILNTSIAQASSPAIQGLAQCEMARSGRVPAISSPPFGQISGTNSCRFLFQLASFLWFCTRSMGSCHSNS